MIVLLLIVFLASAHYARDLHHNFDLILCTDCYDVPAFVFMCPIWKALYGCLKWRILGWSDSISSLCPVTCGLCGAMYSVRPWGSGGQYHGNGIQDPYRRYQFW